jgi:hypothetical protein
MEETTEPITQTFAYVVATLRKLRGRFANNVLVRALPPLPKPDVLKKRLQLLPKFTIATRNLSARERRQRLRALSRFFLVLPNVCELAEFVYDEICEGYVGREPNTPGANRRMQAEYLRGRVERTTKEGGVAHNLCSALMGIPGAGKTFALRQIARLFPPVIYHEDYNLWQIPFLFVQTPYKNNSGENLARAIILAIARLYPPGDYFNLYLDGRFSEAALVGAAKVLLERHRVGILIVDEVQKTGVPPIEEYDGEEIGVLKPSKPSEKWAAGILFEASTDMSVPLLMVATSDLEVALSRRAATMRRRYGNGLRHWDPLDVLIYDGQPSDFDIYMSVLFRCMLLRDPPEYDINFRNVFHYYTFGIPDFILKLFYVVQWRALQEGKETFTVDYVHKIARTFFKEVTRWTRHMRKLAEKYDEQAAQFLSSKPDAAGEFGLKQGLTGMANKASVSAKQAIEEAKNPPTPRAQRGSTPAQPKPALPKPVVAHHSDIGEDS